MPSASRKPAAKKAGGTRKAPAKKPVSQRKSAAKKAGSTRKAPAKKLVSQRKPSAKKLVGQRKPSAKKAGSTRKAPAKKLVSQRKPAAKKPAARKAFYSDVAPGGFGGGPLFRSHLLESEDRRTYAKKFITQNPTRKNTPPKR